ncbi:NAD(P)H-binding protein [Peribacillus sp. SCS-155]|uniref:NAD(P)H-binding protein n=1 Tax=Peribacillus sedimenti TaxID=3115297 RepID=UPI0039066B79
MGGKTALIAGSTGLVGRELLSILLHAKEYDKVISLVRSPQGINHSKLVEKVVDFDHLHAVQESFKADDIFCCLGTTIKKARTQEAMAKVDVDYPLSMARLGKQEGAKQFVIISSMSANPNSSIWYSRMKGNLEEQLTQIDIPALQIVRPSLLLGDRKEFRLGESVAGRLFPLLSFAFFGPLRKYRAIQAKTVAQAMYHIAQQGRPGVNIYLSDRIEDASKQKNL